MPNCWRSSKRGTPRCLLWNTEVATLHTSSTCLLCLQVAVKGPGNLAPDLDKWWTQRIGLKAMFVATGEFSVKLQQWLSEDEER